MRICRTGVSFLPMLVVLLIFSACAGGPKGPATGDSAAPPSSAESKPATLESVQQARPLDTRFDNVVFTDLKTTETIRQDYGEALKEFEQSALTHLSGKNAFARVARDTGAKLAGKSLRVGMKVPDMRITSFGARFWGGAFAGSSFMNVELELVDAATGKTLRTETISSSNNAWGAAYGFGASDRSLPSDMGRIVAEYLATVVPGHK